MSEWDDKWLILFISINDLRSKGWRRMRLIRKFMSQQGHIARTCLNTIEFGWVRRFESEFRVAHCSMNDPLKLNDSKHSHPQTYSPHWPYPSSACSCDASPRSKVVNCESICFGMAIFKRFASCFTASISLGLWRTMMFAQLRKTMQRRPFWRTVVARETNAVKFCPSTCLMSGQLVWNFSKALHHTHQFLSILEFW